MSSTGNERYFFVHLQKTAGTTLRQRVAAMLGETAIYPGAADGDQVGLTFLVDELVDRFDDRADEIRVVFGHFPLCVTELLPSAFRTFTLLREPVARTLSYLRHHRQTTPADRHRSLEDIYADPFRFHGLAHNHMTKMLSLTPDEMTDGMLTRVSFTPERLERAKDALATIDVVGLSEDFEAFCAELRDTFGWPLPEQPTYANRSEPAEVTDAFIARIAEDNAADIELYDHASARLASRAAAALEQDVSPRV